MINKIIPNSFFKKSTIDAAKNLLGLYLVKEIKKGKIIGKIVETEAYLHDDPASHSFKGESKRNKAMFGEPGRAYVYFIYGMYECFNVTTNKQGVGEAVLIRALEPISGIEIMKKNRKTKDVKNLCSGPAKLTIAMGITKKDYGADLTSSKSKLRLEFPPKKEKFKIIAAERIGISQGKSLPHRFYIQGNEYVSKS